MNFFFIGANFPNFSSFVNLYSRDIYDYLVHKFSGLKEYIAASPPLKFESATTVVHSKISDVSSGDYEDEEMQDQFFDATDSSSEEEDSDENEVLDKKVVSLIFSATQNSAACIFVIFLLWNFRILYLPLMFIRMLGLSWRMFHGPSQA